MYCKNRRIIYCSYSTSISSRQKPYKIERHSIDWPIVSCIYVQPIASTHKQTETTDVSVTAIPLLSSHLCLDGLAGRFTYFYEEPTVCNAAHYILDVVLPLSCAIERLFYGALTRLAIFNSLREIDSVAGFAMSVTCTTQQDHVNRIYYFPLRTILFKPYPIEQDTGTCLSFLMARLMPKIIWEQDLGCQPAIFLGL